MRIFGCTLVYLYVTHNLFALGRPISRRLHSGGRNPIAYTRFPSTIQNQAPRGKFPVCSLLGPTTYSLQYDKYFSSGRLTDNELILIKFCFPEIVKKDNLRCMEPGKRLWTLVAFICTWHGRWNNHFLREFFFIQLIHLNSYTLPNYLVEANFFS